MSIRRLWPEDVYVRNLEDIPGRLYSQVVEVTRPNARSVVYVAGTLSYDEHQALVGEDSMATQVKTVLENIRRSLAAVGASPGDVVRTKTYVTDIEAYKREGVPEYVRFFGDRKPTSTAVEVRALADPKCLVEIEAYAELDDAQVTEGRQHDH